MGDFRVKEKSQTVVAERSSIYPQTFLATPCSAGADAYMNEDAIRKLVEFFVSKGLAAIKQEDRDEQWYGDWIAYQQKHRLYADVLSPAEFSNRANFFDLLRYARFIEVFAYCSPAHGYSLQVTFLGLISILMGSNPILKRDAVAALESGELLAFGVSERGHGSDLLSNEFTIADSESGGYIANGSKYYIGNTDAASIISVLGRKTGAGGGSRANRAPFVLFALRPRLAARFQSLGKIRTLGVRAANVGAFAVNDHHFYNDDIIAEGRTAWDAVFGTVTLGKLFLGFGSIGMCERAMQEAADHLKNRQLYGAAAIQMPHLRYNLSQAYCRLTAMKLFAYRALDYVHTATAEDRRYLLYCAVQKAKVSTEGVKVMALLQECIGAKGFESDTYFEMALRDIQLIPSLEGSMHINLGLAMQFVQRYFDRPDPNLPEPPSMVGGEIASSENPYLMTARTGSMRAVGFRDALDAYRSLMAIPNVALFGQQAELFGQIAKGEDQSNLQVNMAMGQCFATVVYGQLVAEHASRLQLPTEMVSTIFSLFVGDMNTLAFQLAAIPELDSTKRAQLLEIARLPQATAADWEFVAARL
jgi:acyl-CoA dehydrogenase